MCSMCDGSSRHSTFLKWTEIKEPKVPLCLSSHGVSARHFPEADKIWPTHFRTFRRSGVVKDFGEYFLTRGELEPTICAEGKGDLAWAGNYKGEHLLPPVPISRMASMHTHHCRARSLALEVCKPCWWVYRTNVATPFLGGLD